MRKLCYAILLGAMVLPQLAHAIRIRNVDKVAYQFEVEYIGGATESVVLEPNRTFRMATPSLRVKLDENNVVRIRQFEEYVFLNGVFVLQKRDYRNSGR